MLAGFLSLQFCIYCLLPDQENISERPVWAQGPWTMDHKHFWREEEEGDGCEITGPESESDEGEGGKRKGWERCIGKEIIIGIRIIRIEWRR